MKRVAWMPAVLAAVMTLAGAVLFLTGCEDEVAAGVLGGRDVATQEQDAPEAVESTPDEMHASVSGEESGAFTASSAVEETEQAEAQVVDGVMEIGVLVDDTASYLGKSVAVQGTILAQCIRGCRFSLDDGTGVVNIELVDEALEDVLMKGSVGRAVEVRGIVDSASPVRILVEDRGGWEYVD